MSIGHTSRTARRWLTSALLLGLGLAAGCFSDGARQRLQDTVPQPQTTDPSTEPVRATPPGQETAAVEDGSNQAPDDLDAGPLQFQFLWDASTTPTSDYVHDVDAAAGEATRGQADQDAGPDAN